MSKKENKNKTISTIISVIILIIVALFGGDSLINNFTAESQVVSSGVHGLDNVKIQTGDSCITSIDVNEDVLRVYYFDVGQADSILIVNNGESMLIDAGNNADGNLVVNNLKTIGINKLTYVIGTHPHEDHIGRT